MADDNITDAAIVDEDSEDIVLEGEESSGNGEVLVEGAEGAEGEEERSFWDVLEDRETEISSMVWISEVRFPLSDGRGARGLFATTTKDKAIDKIFSAIAVPEVEFDVAKYTTKTQAIREFFEDQEDRSVFVALAPVE